MRGVQRVNRGLTDTVGIGFGRVMNCRSWRRRGTARPYIDVDGVKHFYSDELCRKFGGLKIRRGAIGRSVRQRSLERFRWRHSELRIDAQNEARRRKPRESRTVVPVPDGRILTCRGSAYNLHLVVEVAGTRPLRLEVWGKHIPYVPRSWCPF